MNVEIHEHDDWAAIYLNGKLQRAGDIYLADEWVREHFGVVTVYDNAFMLGSDKRADTAQTLADVAKYRADRDGRRERAAELRAQATKLMAEAEGLSR